jgi:hypothetical protein
MPGGDMPPIQPPGSEYVECVRPQNWWSIAFWIDYEVCDIKRFVSWGPSNSATVEAIPTMFSSKEPFSSIGQIQSGFNQLTTQVASRSWNNTGFPGVSNQVNPIPDHIFNPLAPGNPWSAGGSINLNNTTGITNFSKYCSTQLSTMLASRLSEGLCFVLNITKSIGYLGWVSFVFNVALIFATIRLVLSTLNYYGNFIQSQVPTNEMVEAPARQAQAQTRKGK